MSTSVESSSNIQKVFASALQFVIDQDPLCWYKGKDWNQKIAPFHYPDLTYPGYYQTHNFHGIRGGYLSVEAALSYDAISQWLLLPHEGMIRRKVIETVERSPRKILDLGCGTGSMTLLLKQTFPESEVIGLDLSPYMLSVAAQKARQANLDIQFLHSNAELTDFDDRSFDLITASLLFHETPVSSTQTILQESYRLLSKGGEIVILDGNQKGLKNGSWVDRLFEEPFLAEYSSGDMNHWLHLAGFRSVTTDSLWWLHQISRGTK